MSSDTVRASVSATANPAPVKPVIQRTLTRVDLSDAVYRRVGLSRAESAILVEMVIREISESLVAREAVKLTGFGTFTVRPKSERLGRNPKTGAGATITARHVVVFRASNIMRAEINRGQKARRPRQDMAGGSDEVLDKRRGGVLMENDG